MNNWWSYLKRFGKYAGRHLKSAMPVLLLVGVVFLLVAIWWLGPQWQWGDRQPLADISVRVLLTVLVILVPVLIWALILRSRNKAFEQERKENQRIQEDPTIRFVKAQERALDRSFSVFREHLGQGKNSLYELPWYLVLGQENAGKTSFINRSNQNFTLTGVTKAGSRQHDDPDLLYSIDWWMGEQAVLIDPPGEIISQSEVSSEGVSENADAMSDLPAGTHARLWDNLVGWLGRNRSRRPLNGVVLIVDIVNLLEQAASDRKALAILLRARLSELSQQLGIRLPIYVVMTKFDQLEGFSSFFARLPRSVREEIFGFTFTLDSVQDFDSWLTELSARYDDLIKRMNEQIFDALSEVATLEEREQLFSLVRQLAGLRPVLLSFLSEVLGSDRYATPALVRGLYFSSVYQQGMVNNAFVNSAAHSYGLEAQVPEVQPYGRSVVYFAQRLFQQVIYPEAGLAGDNLKVLASKRRTLMVSGAVAALGALVVIGGWQHYYNINREKVDTVLARSQEFSSNKIAREVDPTGLNLLVPLDQIRAAVEVYGDYRSAWPVLADMGLYQGREIGPKVDEAYLQLLSQRYLPSLATGVLHKIDEAKSDSEQLNALRVYRMIEDRENRRPLIVSDWMAKYWQTRFPADGLTQNALMVHLDYALKYADTELPQYRKRISEIQRHLRQLPLQQRVYMAMKHQAREIFYSPLDLRHEIGPEFDIVYEPAQFDFDNEEWTSYSTQIEALLTSKGFHEYFTANSDKLTELAMVDQWTLGERSRIEYSEEDKKVLSDRLRTLYNADYINTWRRGLNQLEVVDFEDIGQAVDVLSAVTGTSAPLRRLVETVEDNSHLYTEAAVVETAKDTQISAEDSLNRKQAAAIGRAFAPITDLLIGKGEKPPYLDSTMLAVGSVYDVVKGVQDSPDRGKAALSVVADRFTLKTDDPIGNLQRVANGLPEPLNNQVRKLATESSQVLLVEALRELERRWDAEVYSFYQEKLANRYPFNPASNTDVSLQDFEAFFGPNGLLQNFKTQYLKMFLEDNLDALYSERLGGYLVRTDVLQQLEAADRIRDAFFNSRGAIGVQFTVEPLGLTPNRRSSVLGVDGQLITYNHGPTRSVGLIWPNTLGEGAESRVTLINGSGNSSSLQYRGSWSLFRLLSRAHLSGSTPNSVDLSFKADDGTMRYRITAEKANNPFTQRPFQNFMLPRTLLQGEFHTSL